MNQITELNTLQELRDHNYEDIWASHAPMYLYQYIRDVTAISGIIIQRGTLQLAEVSSNLTTVSLNPDDPRRRVKLNVHYQMTPGEFQFRKVRIMVVEVVLFQDVRVFHLGEIGKEISETFTPEQAANKYFGNPDFSKFFSTRRPFSKRKSLEYHANHAEPMERPLYSELALAKTVPLLGTHSQILQDATHRSMQSPSWMQRMSAAFTELSLLPTSRLTYNAPQNIEQTQIQKMIGVPLSERNELLTKGALSAQLMKRLSQHPTDAPNGRRDRFRVLHKRVHDNRKFKKSERGGSKKSKKAKTRKTRC